jgi:hypothetical protein
MMAVRTSVYLALEGDDINLVGVLGDLKRGFEQPQQLPLLQVQPHRDVLGPAAVVVHVSHCVTLRQEMLPSAGKK